MIDVKKIIAAFSEEAVGAAIYEHEKFDEGALKAIECQSAGRDDRANVVSKWLNDYRVFMGFTREKRKKSLSE